MIEHLKGREKALSKFGWSAPHATWAALVCLHSGLFTRAQFCAYFGSRGAPAWRSQAKRFVRSLLDHKLAVLEPIDGLPTTTRPCRITHKSIYRALGIPDVRHRRAASGGVLLRRLLSLDYVLDHPNQAWLPTEPEKVEAFERLEIPNQTFPRRHYHGRGKGQVRYFPVKLPIALDDRAATFVYCDPGRDSDSELLYWGRSHARLWTALRQAGREVHIVAVARDHDRQQRAKKVLIRWAEPGEGAEFQPLTPDEKDQLSRIEQAVRDDDQEYLAQFGGWKQAMNYRVMLLKRPAGLPAKNRVRIDQGTAWLSSRLPAEEEPENRSGPARVPPPGSLR
ncbi:MAG: hypothetical protein OXU64_03045 [Gemmatimonadota bacterium]|nr:hypothetical protein [Deltaproteobacteria bacterium]MDE2973690.1 hypothetical protein [Gemmatimonadota bacterium]